MGLVGLALLLTACSADQPTGPLPDPPTPTSTEALDAHMESSGTPTVVNVWASWCTPCRSEAPLVSQASASHPDTEFIGLNVRDRDPDAQRFIAEYLWDADMLHLSDQSGRVPIDLGGTSGVPLTFFYYEGGDLAYVHLGIIDEPTMARYLDEIER